METFESTEVALEDVNRIVIAGRMLHIAGEQFQLSKYSVLKTSNISANGAFAKGVPSLVVAHLGGIRTEKPNIPRINPLTHPSI